MMHKISIQSILALALVLFAGLTAQAQETAGKVIMSRGDVQAINLDGEIRKLKRRDSVFSNEIIKTGDKSKVQIRFVDNALLALKANSELNIKSYIFDQAENSNNQVLLELVAGGFRTLTGQIGKGNKAAYKVDTPVASIGIRGTLYDVQVAFDKIYAGVWNGGISLDTEQGQFDLGFGANFDFAEVGANGDFTGLLTPPEVFTPPAASQQDQEESKQADGEEGDDKKSPEQGDFQQGQQQDQQQSEQDQQQQSGRPDVAGNKAPNPFEKDQAPQPDSEEELSNLEFKEEDNTNNDPDGSDNPDGSEDPDIIDRASPDLRLSEAEWDQLVSSENSKVALLITESGTATAVTLNDDQGNPFYVNSISFTNADGTQSPGIETIRRGKAQLRTAPTPWSDQVNWGIWAGSAENPIQRFQEYNNNTDFKPLEGEMFFMNVAPASSAEMNNGLASGLYDFSTAPRSSLPIGTSDFIASSSGGTVIDVSGQFSFDVSNGDISFSANPGYLLIEVSTDANLADAEQGWDMGMINATLDGSALNADLDGRFHAAWAGEPLDEGVSANGSLGGVFLAPAEGQTDISEFAGGFQVDTLDGTESAGGVIIMQGQIVPQ